MCHGPNVVGSCPASGTTPDGSASLGAGARDGGPGTAVTPLPAGPHDRWRCRATVALEALPQCNSGTLAYSRLTPPPERWSIYLLSARSICHISTMLRQLDDAVSYNDASPRPAAVTYDPSISCNSHSGFRERPRQISSASPYPLAVPRPWMSMFSAQPPSELNLSGTHGIVSFAFCAPDLDIANGAPGRSVRRNRLSANRLRPQSSAVKRRGPTRSVRPAIH